MSNPVQVWISPESVGIPFGTLVDKRREPELARLAALMRDVPGVAPHIEDLEARDYRAWPGMRPEEVFGLEQALDAWKRALAEATRKPDGKMAPSTVVP